jgi:hypothetical protein
MELSDAQFEHLVGMLADNRVAIVNVEFALMTELEKTKRELREEIKAAVSGQGLLTAHLTAIEEDVGKVQATLRGHTEELGKVDRQLRFVHQSLEGVTQLCKSTWDLTESLQKHIHGEASLENVSGLESHRAE